MCLLLDRLRAFFHLAFKLSVEFLQLVLCLLLFGYINRSAIPPFSFPGVRVDLGLRPHHKPPIRSVGSPNAMLYTKRSIRFTCMYKCLQGGRTIFGMQKVGGN